MLVHLKDVPVLDHPMLNWIRTVNNRLLDQTLLQISDIISYSPTVISFIKTIPSPSFPSLTISSHSSSFKLPPTFSEIVIAKWGYLVCGRSLIIVKHFYLLISSISLYVSFSSFSSSVSPLDPDFSRFLFFFYFLKQ